MGKVLRANYDQRFLLPPSLDEWVPAEHPVRFVRAFVDELDLQELGIRQPKGDEGRPPYAAELLLGVWLFGYMERVRSTRMLEKSCLQVMPFMWLTGNLHPDHNTIWRFFRDNRKVLPKLFKRMVQMAKAADLIGFALHALDGTKLTAASSTDTALHRKSLEEKLKELDKLIEQYVAEVESRRTKEEQAESYKMPEPMRDPSALRNKIRELLARRIEDREDRLDAKTAHGAQPFEVSSDANSADEVEPSEARAAPQPEPQTSASDEAETSTDVVLPAPKPEVDAFKAEADALKTELVAQIQQLDAAEANHLHPKETDARMMKGRGMHALGYNAQAVVDHDSDLILACDVVVQANDQGQLVPMLTQVRETLGRVADQSLGDGGYCSGEELQKAEAANMPVLVRIPEEAATKGAFSKSHFQFDAETNVYVCPKGEQLVQIGTSKPRAGATHSDAIYRCHNKTCPVRQACSTSKQGRQIRRTPFEAAMLRQEEKQQDPRMLTLLTLRKEIIEHTFGIVKTIDGFRRFTVRGLEKVKGQWALVCSAVNLRKLYAFWRQGKLTLGSGAAATS